MSSGVPDALRPATTSDGRRWPHLRLVPPAGNTGDIEIALALLSAVALFGLLFLPLEQLAPLVGECQFKVLTGQPCATCGMTRGLLALSHGRLGEALSFNPLFLGGALALGAYGLASWWLWLGRRHRPRLFVPRGRARWVVFAAVVTAVVVNWAYLIVSGI